MLCAGEDELQTAQLHGMQGQGNGVRLTLQCPSIVDLDSIVEQAQQVLDADAELVKSQAAQATNRAGKAQRGTRVGPRAAVVQAWDAASFSAHERHVGAVIGAFQARLTVAREALTAFRTCRLTMVPSHLVTFEKFVQAIGTLPITVVEVPDCTEIGVGITPGDGFCLYWCLTVMRLHTASLPMVSLGLRTEDGKAALSGTLRILQGSVTAPACGWDVLMSKLSDSKSLHCSEWGVEELVGEVSPEVFGTSVYWSQSSYNGRALLRQLPDKCLCLATVAISDVLECLGRHPDSLCIVNRQGSHFYFMSVDGGKHRMTGAYLLQALHCALRDLYHNVCQVFGVNPAFTV